MINNTTTPPEFAVKRILCMSHPDLLRFLKLNIACCCSEKGPQHSSVFILLHQSILCKYWCNIRTWITPPRRTTIIDQNHLHFQCAGELHHPYQFLRVEKLTTSSFNKQLKKNSNTTTTITTNASTVHMILM